MCSLQPRADIEARPRANARLPASLENLLDWHSEQFGDLEGKRQRRIELAAFDGVDALPGYTELLGEFDLAPSPLDTQYFYTVVQVRPLELNLAQGSACADSQGRERFGKSTHSAPDRCPIL